MRYLKTTTIIGLSLLFVACQKEDVTVEASKDHTMMSFEARMEVSGGAVTRGTPITSVSQMETMAVFVYNTGSSTWATAGATASPNVMNNMKLLQGYRGWDYSPLKPWQNQYNTIFAYAPSATASNGITVQPSYTGAPTIEYIVPATCADQPDLMVAAMQEDKYLGTVSFEMEHALACVGFKVNGRYKEKITKIAIKGVSVSGTLSLDRTAGSAPQWSNVAAATDTEYTPGVKGSLVGDGTMMDVMNVDGYLMMIPQALKAGATMIVTVDGEDREVTLSDKEWKAGERYTYNIEIPYDPIIIGYFGGWDDVNKEYTKLLQVDWEIAERDPLLKWSNDLTITGATNIHYGPTNIDILKGLSLNLSNYPAAKYCEDRNNGTGWNKDGGGWYLPSQNQLMAIWIAYESIPSKFLLDTIHKHYWSSTERSDQVSWCVGFFPNMGNVYNTNKRRWDPFRVRCVRDVTS